MPRALLGVLLLSATGCSWSHSFTLEEIGKLKLGVTTHEEAETLLHSEHGSTGSYYSTEQTCLPPAPISLISWPLFSSRHRRSYDLKLSVDARGIVQAGTLEIGEQSATTVLLVFGPNDFTATLSDAEIALLRRLQEEGFRIEIGVTPIRCFGGILGWRTQSLDDYLGLGD